MMDNKQAAEHYWQESATHDDRSQAAMKGWKTRRDHYERHVMREKEENMRTYTFCYDILNDNGSYVVRDQCVTVQAEDEGDARSILAERIEAQYPSSAGYHVANIERVA